MRSGGLGIRASSARDLLSTLPRPSFEHVSLARTGASLAWRGVRIPRRDSRCCAWAGAFVRAIGIDGFRSFRCPRATILRWRMYTAYGDDAVVPPADDVVRYARWAVKDS